MLPRRVFLKCLSLAVLGLAPTQGASAQESKTDLFKVITVKDEIVIGLSADELKALGGTDASAVAHALAQKGDMAVCNTTCIAVRTANCSRHRPPGSD